jgi:hypothetical protein
LGNLLLGENNILKNRELKVDWENKINSQSAKATERVNGKRDGFWKIVRSV